MIYFLEDFDGDDGEYDDHYGIGGENQLEIVSCETLMTRQKRETSLALNVIIITLEVVIIMKLKEGHKKNMIFSLWAIHPPPFGSFGISA